MPSLSILVIPAASCLPMFYDMVVHGVRTKGYDIQALHIPSVGLVTGARDGEPPTMYDDAAFLAAHITRIADAGHDVLLITHSYGGTAATESVKGLSKSERQRQGRCGGVVGIAYMTSLVPEVGEPASPGSQSPLMEIGEDGWFYYPDISLVATVVFSDLPQEEGEAWGRKLVKHSAANFASPLTYGGCKTVPVSYLVCEGDRSVSVEKQRSQIEMIERVSGNSVDVTNIGAGHGAPVSAPQDVISWILRVAEKYAYLRSYQET